ncbi:long-chain fatty acid--CoA ligase [bacterium]|nr:long-chain fatty acid--CoA ligase [bacterium]
MSIKDGFPVPHALLSWLASDTECPFKTIPGVFRETVRRWGDHPYVGKRVGKRFEFKTYNQVFEEVQCFASNLIELGFEKEDRVANYCNNRQEWPVIDEGAGYIGCIHVPMYPTLSQSEMAFIVKGSEARLVVAPDSDHLTRVLNVASECFHLRHVVCIEPFERDSVEVPEGVRLWSWDDFIQAGREALKKNHQQMEEMFNSVQPDDVFSLVYTSGTTGDPKGAMLMHANFVCQAVPLAKAVLGVSPSDYQLSFLPLSHVFERIAHYALMSGGAAIGFSKSIATVTSDMVILKPSIVPSVPRLFEKVFAKAVEQSAGGMRNKVFQQAIKVGREYREAKAKGSVSFFLKAQHALYDKLVYSKVREKVGGNVRFFISGGAPLRRDVAEFFSDVGLCILEGYSLTETAPVLAVNYPNKSRIGTVGIVPPYVEVKIADDGEIIARGSNIMLGYYGLPDATREVVDEDGWFHTGDIGEFDEDGFLTITDRKKEILVLSNGKNVAPQPIELALCGNLFIAQAVLVGNNRGYVAAIIVPNFEKLEGWAKDQKLSFADRDALVKLPEVVSMYKDIVRQVCEPLSNYENVRRIHLLNRELSQASGEITPTLKVKRRIIDSHLKDEIEAMFAGDN